MRLPDLFRILLIFKLNIALLLWIQLVQFVTMTLYM